MFDLDPADLSEFQRAAFVVPFDWECQAGTSGGVYPCPNGIPSTCRANTGGVSSVCAKCYCEVGSHTCCTYYSENNTYSEDGYWYGGFECPSALLSGGELVTDSAVNYCEVGDAVSALYDDGESYKFADGMLYSGGFKNGLPDGEGSAWYPGGTKYKGHWRDGLHEGTGVMTYATGSTYDGYWKDGKRQGEGKLTFASGTVYEGHFWLGKYHGRGRVTSPTTGFEFVGSFHRGFVNGPGALVWPDGERDTRNWASYGGMTLKQLIEYALQEKAEKAAKKTKERDAAFSVRLAVRLQDYVTSVRDDINAEREEKKIEAEATRRALVQERKEKARELREKALASLSAAADEATGAEADANFDAAAEI